MIRDDLVAFAKTLDGLSADPKSPRFDEYLALIAPDETHERAVEMSHMSGCALVVAGIWRACGLGDHRLDAPYVDQSAVSRLDQIATDARARLRIDLGLRPLPGDVVLLGGPEHVYTIVEVRDDLVIGIDGGQRDANGYELIEIKEHLWQVGGFEQSRRPGESLHGRRVITAVYDVVYVWASSSDGR